MIPGFGPFGTRDPVADLMSSLAEINLTPDFDALSRDQREKIQTLRKDYDQRQSKWRTDHADEIRRVQNQMMAPFFRGPGAKPLSAEEAQALAKSREDLLASSPVGDGAAQQIEQTLTEPRVWAAACLKSTTCSSDASSATQAKSISPSGCT
jgi:hypothetical protein